MEESEGQPASIIMVEAVPEPGIKWMCMSPSPIFCRQTRNLDDKTETKVNPRTLVRGKAAGDGWIHLDSGFYVPTSPFPGKTDGCPFRCIAGEGAIQAVVCRNSPQTGDKSAVQIDVGAYVFGNFDPPGSDEWIKLDNGLYVPWAEKFQGGLGEGQRTAQLFVDIEPLFKQVPEGARELRYVDFIPRPYESDIDAVVDRANGALALAKFNIISMETVSVARSLQFRRNTRIFIPESRSEVNYQFIRVWYDACDEANSTMQAQALFEELNGQAFEDEVVALNKENKESQVCVIL